jgi:hypothetical protein
VVATPVPFSVTASDGVTGSLLAIESVSVAAPTAVGVNFRVTFWVDVPPILNGVDGDTTENTLLAPAPSVIPLIVRLPVPKLITVSVAVEFWPMFVLGNTTGFGIAPILTVVGLPLIGIARFVQVSVTDSVAVAGPAATGENLTGIVSVWVGVRITGTLTVPSENTVPVWLRLAADTVTFPLPVFVMTTFCVAVVPSAVLLKVTDVGLAVTAHPVPPQPCGVRNADTKPIDRGDVLRSPVVIVAVMKSVGVWTGLKNGAGTKPLNDQSKVLPVTSFGSTVKVDADMLPMNACASAEA